jgi:hypothetical protein
MEMNGLPAHERGKAKLLVRAVFLVALAGSGVFAATALSSSTIENQPARMKPIPAKHALAAAKVDLSTTPKIRKYLRSIGVNPRSVVIQRGHKNYAGPKCPGKAWTCTKARRVMQLGTQNTFECTATPTPTTFAQTNAPPGFQECVIVQGPAAKNVAKCIEKSKHVPFVRQRCSITQTGSYNEAIVIQLADQVSGPAELALQQLGALQEVGIFQTATASVNRLQIDQEIKQLSETTAVGITQDQDAYQVVAGPFGSTPTDPPGPSPVSTGPAQQFALVLADNASQIVQKQIQRAKGGATQKQNEGTYAPPAPFGGVPADCHSGTDLDGTISVINPTACVNFAQQAADGTNHQGQLSQSIDMEASTTVVGAVQKQHTAKFTGGADARVHQLITGMSGTSQNQAKQSETLRMYAPPGATQDQHGGASCCGFGSQDGGVGNSEQLEQVKDLFASGSNQTATLVGTSRSPEGTCAISHNAKTNEGQASESTSEDGCLFLAVVTNCDENACQETDVAACEAGEEPDLDVGEDGNISVDCEGGNGNGTTTTTCPPLCIGVLVPSLAFVRRRLARLRLARLRTS